MQNKLSRWGGGGWGWGWVAGLTKNKANSAQLSLAGVWALAELGNIISLLEVTSRP